MDNPEFTSNLGDFGILLDVFVPAAAWFINTEPRTAREVVVLPEGEA